MIKFWSYFLSIILIYPGYLHLAKPKAFLKAMPSYLPWHMPLIYITGVIEILLAIGLVFEKTRSLSGYLTAMYFIAIWPANFHISYYQIPMFGISNVWALWARTVFQVVLIYWAYWIGKSS